MPDDVEVPGPPLPAEPPKLAGPHFALVAGKISLVTSTSADLNLPRLEKMVPALRDAVGDALTQLRQTNAYSRLARTLSKYAAALEGDVSDLDYELVAALGILLSNAEAAAEREIVDRMLPDMEDELKASLKDVLDLNGIVVLSTEAGRQILSDASQYRQTAREDHDFREAAREVAEAITDNDFATADAAILVEQAAADIGTGPQPERSTLLATRIMASAGLALLAGAAVVAAPTFVFGSLGWAAMLILGDGIKRSTLGQRASDVVTEIINDPKGYSDLRRVRDFVWSLDPKLRAVAGDRREFAWMLEWLDYVRTVRKTQLDPTWEPKMLAYLRDRLLATDINPAKPPLNVTALIDGTLTGLAFLNLPRLVTHEQLEAIAAAIASGPLAQGYVLLTMPPDRLAALTQDEVLSLNDKGPGTKLELFTGSMGTAGYQATGHAKINVALGLWTVKEIRRVFVDPFLSEGWSRLNALLLQDNNNPSNNMWVAAHSGKYTEGDVAELAWSELRIEEAGWYRANSGSLHALKLEPGRLFAGKIVVPSKGGAISDYDRF